MTLLTTRSRRYPVCALALLVSLFAPPRAAAEAPLAEIRGGVAEDGQNYAWTIINRHDSPLVYVRMTHFRADMWTIPPRWEPETTYLVNVGVEERPGVCIARAPTPAVGIPPGGRGKFAMRIARAGARRGTGEVELRFADGTTTTISGVQLPAQPTTGEHYVNLIGFSILVAGFVLYQMIRRRRGATTSAQVGDTPVETDAPERDQN